jgi:hypothetical protein
MKEKEKGLKTMNAWEREKHRLREKKRGWERMGKKEIGLERKKNVRNEEKSERERERIRKKEKAKDWNGRDRERMWEKKKRKERKMWKNSQRKKFLEIKI